MFFRPQATGAQWDQGIALGTYRRRSCWSNQTQCTDQESFDKHKSATTDSRAALQGMVEGPVSEATGASSADPLDRADLEVAAIRRQDAQATPTSFPPPGVEVSAQPYEARKSELFGNISLEGSPVPCPTVPNQAEPRSRKKWKPEEKR